MTEPYGTVRYYSDLFMDIIADVNPDDQSTGDIIIEAFKLAIKDWRQYYEEGAKEIRRIEQKANDENRCPRNTKVPITLTLAD